MRIDLAAAIATAEELLTTLQDLDGTEPDDTPTRKGRRERVEVNRTLQYLAHLGDKVRVQVMEQYYAAREHDDQVRGRDDADPAGAPGSLR